MTCKNLTTAYWLIDEGFNAVHNCVSQFDTQSVA